MNQATLQLKPTATEPPPKAPHQKLKAKILLLFTILICGFILMKSRAYLSQQSQTNTAAEQDLYLPAPPYLKFISLGNDVLISDLILARALTYFGSHYQQRHTFQFKHLYPLFSTAVEMDPQNKEAFLFAANTLGPINTHNAIAILEQGMLYHPAEWKFPEMIGFNYFYYLKDKYRAGLYYEKASHLPNHPPYVPSLSGTFYRESGRYLDALRVLNNFYTTTSDKRLKKSFETTIEKIKEQIQKKQFRLSAKIIHIINANTIQFKPDLNNPQFQSLNPIETLQITHPTLPRIPLNNKQQELLSYFQKDYLQYFLLDSDVQIEFDRDPNGKIRTTSQNYFTGSIFLENDSPYNPDFLLKELSIFPPPEIPLKEILENTGKLVTVQFTIYRVDEAKEGVYLRSALDQISYFDVQIPIESISNFIPNSNPDYFKQMIGKPVTVSGFAGVHNQRIEIRLHHPSQISPSI